MRNVSWYFRLRQLTVWQAYTVRDSQSIVQAYEFDDVIALSILYPARGMPERGRHVVADAPVLYRICILSQIGTCRLPRYNMFLKRTYNVHAAPAVSQSHFTKQQFHANELGMAVIVLFFFGSSLSCVAPTLAFINIRQRPALDVIHTYTHTHTHTQTHTPPSSQCIYWQP